MTQPWPIAIRDDSGVTRLEGEAVGTPNGSQGVLVQTTPLTVLRIRSLDTVPVAVTPAPGAGKAIVPVRLAVVLLFATTPYTAGFGLTVVYEGEAYSDPSQFFVDDAFCAATESSVCLPKQNFGGADGSLYTTAHLDDARLMVWADTSVDTDGDSPVAVTCWYTIADLT